MAIVPKGIASLSKMTLEIERDCINDSVTIRRVGGPNLGRSPAKFTDSQIRNAHSLIGAIVPASLVAPEIGLSPVTSFRGMSQ